MDLYIHRVPKLDSVFRVDGPFPTCDRSDLCLGRGVPHSISIPDPVLVRASAAFGPVHVLDLVCTRSLALLGLLFPWSGLERNVSLFVTEMKRQTAAGYKKH